MPLIFIFSRWTLHLSYMQFVLPNSFQIVQAEGRGTSDEKRTSGDHSRFYTYFCVFHLLHNCNLYMPVSMHYAKSVNFLNFLILKMIHSDFKDFFYTDKTKKYRKMTGRLKFFET